MERVLGSAPTAPRTFGVSWPLLVALSTLFGVLLGMPPGATLGDPDVYWHLAAGRWIVEHGALPNGDPFSHSMPGAAWMMQSWLTEVVFALSYRIGGWSALVIMAATCFAVTLAYLTRFLLARMEPVHALLFVGFAAGLLLTHLSVRPHVLTWPLLALWIGAQVDASESHRGPPWWLLPVMCLWANLHGSFTLGLALGGGLALDAVAAHPAVGRWKAARRWIVFLALAVLVSMLTPNGWQGIWYTVQVMRQGYAQSVIAEWLSPDFHRIQGLEIWLLLVLALGWSGRMLLPLTRILLLLGLVHLALVSGRSISTLGLVSPFILAAPLARQWYSRGSLGGGGDAEQLDRWFRAFAAPAGPVGLALATVLATALLVTIVPARNPSPDRAITPDAALQAARAGGVSGEVLNNYNFGGYLISQGVKVLIDGRSDMYGDAFMKRYLDALLLKDPQLLQPLLDEYRIGWTFLAPGTPAIAVLDRLPGWRRVHADDLAVVHTRVLATAPR
jgi:hypothetical protein